jgi:hypothetical protein
MYTGVLWFSRYSAATSVDLYRSRQWLIFDEKMTILHVAKKGLFSAHFSL